MLLQFKLITVQKVQKQFFKKGGTRDQSSNKDRRMSLVTVKKGGECLYELPTVAVDGQVLGGVEPTKDMATSIAVLQSAHDALMQYFADAAAANGAGSATAVVSLGVSSAAVASPSTATTAAATGEDEHSNAFQEEDEGEEGDDATNEPPQKVARTEW